MSKAETRPNSPPAKVEAAVRSLLARPMEDRALRDQLEQLALEQNFDGLTWLWGPVLYKRNRTLFRPFILSHFSTWVRVGQWEMKNVVWKKEVAAALEPWLAEVDANDDIELFKRLYRWKHTSERGWGTDDAKWRIDVGKRFAAALTPAQRAKVLAKYEGFNTLDEQTAVALYLKDAQASSKFILKHLPRSFWGEDKRVMFNRLFAEAIARGDHDFAFSMYRKQVPLKQWEAEALRLCSEVADSRKLDEELERRHPEGWGLDLGGPIYRIVERRKRDVLPYVFRHLRNVFGHWYRSSYDKLLALAQAEQWLDLWAAILRTCARAEDYNKAINRLLDDSNLYEHEKQRRLIMLTGASREWNFPGFGLASVHSLEEATSLKLYAQFPWLVRGPFKLHVAGTWACASDKLIQKVIDAKDDVLLDFLASRVVTRNVFPHQPWSGGVASSVDVLADYYTNLKLDEKAFSRRAAAVLTQVPAFSIFAYGQLIRGNRFARLLFERSARSYLADRIAVGDLVEGSEIHVQALAYRTLGLDDPRARELARENLDILIGTLLRPLHRKTRMLAFGALKNAASTPEVAKTVLERAKLALDLPDQKYPKEELVGLIGEILWRYPELRGEKEQPVVYEHAGRAA